MSNRIGIKHQLISVLAVVVLGFIGIGLAYQTVLGVDDAAFADAENFHEIGVLTERIHRGMLAAQAAGNEFLLNNRLEAVEQHRQAIAGVDDDMVRLSHRVTDEAGRSLIERIRPSVQRYQAGFEHIVQLRQLYGLDAASGHLGELHQAARAMEDVIKQYGASAQDLWTSMLLMRRNEKDYIAYRDPESLSRMPAERTRFEMFLEGGMLLQEDQDAIKPRLHDYYAAFDRLVGLIQRVDRENLALKEALQALEPVLAELQRHKDAWLEQGKQQVHAARLQIGQLFVGVIAVAGVLASLLLLLTMRSVLRPLGGEPVVIAALVKQVAGGDLRINLARTGQERGIYAAVGDMISQWRGIVTQVGQTTLQVSASAEQLVEESTNLAQRTEQQATALEETAASMEELTSTVANSAENAAQAERLAHGARTRAEEGGRVIQEAMQSMSAINDSNQRIATIITVVDEIAFQTNLLALNAAVEAARAGEQGRGFAVVAGEVRRLAQRSADAAKEIKTLITHSTDEVREGARWVQQSGQVLQTIILEARNVTDIIAEMAVATREQALGIEQVNQALRQLDQGTQQNARLAEDAATASAAMLEQAAELQRLMDFFKCAGDDAVTVSTATTSVDDEVSSPVRGRWPELAYSPA